MNNDAQERLRNKIVISTYLLSGVYLLVAASLFFLLTLIDFREITMIDNPFAVFLFMIGFFVYVLAIGLGSIALVFCVLFFLCATKYTSNQRPPFILYMVHLALMALSIVGILRSIIAALFFGHAYAPTVLLIIAGLLTLNVTMMIPSLLVLKYHQLIKGNKDITTPVL